MSNFKIQEDPSSNPILPTPIMLSQADSANIGL